MSKILYILWDIFKNMYFIGKKVIYPHNLAPMLKDKLSITINSLLNSINVLNLICRIN